MAGAGYDVVVDVDVDEEGDLGHTDLQEDLEFHTSTFNSGSGSNSNSKPATNTLPPPATAPSSSSKRLLWTLEFYAQFFDVDTSAVLKRCGAALYPRVNFLDVLDGNADLYGPVWIATSVVFILFLGGTINAYLERSGEAIFVYDFTLLSGAAGLIYGYTVLIPMILYISIKYTHPLHETLSLSLLDCYALYGYSNLIWIPVALVAWSPLTILNWIIVGVGFGVSITFLLRTLYPIVNSEGRRASMVVMVALVLCHAALAVAVKSLFFKKGSLITDPAAVLSTAMLTL